MATQNWEVVNKVNFIHGIDFTDGLSLDGEFCYAMELLDGNAFVAIKNKIVTDKADVKFKALIRRNCTKLEPFFFVRYDSTSGQAYVMKIENNINLYKLDFSDPSTISAASPITSGLTTIAANTTYNLSFFVYTLLDGSCVFECSIFDTPTNSWKTEIKQVIMPDISSGDVGFGAFYKFATLQAGCSKVFIDDIEISTPVIFI